MKKINRKQFYLLSFTWGLPLSLFGVIVCLALRVFGCKPQRYGYCYCIEIGKTWGGLEFGWFFLAGKENSEFIKKHELGHGYQNACLYGWVTPVLWLIAACRYWLQRLGVRMDYHKWFYEAKANDIGAYIMEGSEDEKTVE